MKKAILILVLGLLLSTNAYANELESSKVHIFKQIPSDTLGKKEARKNSARLKYAKDYCAQLKKNTYTFAYQNNFEDVFKVIFAKDYFRFICAGSKIEAVENLRSVMNTKWAKNYETDYQKKIRKLGIAPSIDHIQFIYDAKEEIEKIIIAEKEEKKKIAEKKEEEKKKEPKTTEPSPDDNKVVAAASGSGFFVSNTGHIVTNHHVIDECKAVKVNFKGNEIEAKILAIDKTNDLAILKAKINPSKVYSVSNEDVTLLQDVIVAGFPLGKKVSAAIKTHKGSVSALAGFGDNYSNFQTDATINQGNSGGPVMDQKGNIVGVAVALMSAEAGQNIFFAVKSSTLKTFANANGITFLPPNNREMSNAELGQLITEGTLFLECWMTIAKIKQIIAQEENRKAFYSEFK